MSGSHFVAHPIPNLLAFTACDLKKNGTFYESVFAFLLKKLEMTSLSTIKKNTRRCFLKLCWETTNLCWILRCMFRVDICRRFLASDKIWEGKAFTWYSIKVERTKPLIFFTRWLDLSGRRKSAGLKSRENERGNVLSWMKSLCKWRLLCHIKAQANLSIKQVSFSSSVPLFLFSFAAWQYLPLPCYALWSRVGPIAPTIFAQPASPQRTRRLRSFFKLTTESFEKCWLSLVHWLWSWLTGPLPRVSLSVSRSAATPRPPRCSNTGVRGVKTWRHCRAKAFSSSCTLSSKLCQLTLLSLCGQEDQGAARQMTQD